MFGLKELVVKGMRWVGLTEWATFNPPQLAYLDAVEVSAEIACDDR